MNKIQLYGRNPSMSLSDLKTKMAERFEKLKGTYLPDFTNPANQGCLRTYAISGLCICLSLSAIYMANNDPTFYRQSFYLYTTFILLPILIGLFLISPLFSDKLTPKLGAAYAVLFFVFLMTVYAFYQIMNPASVLYITKFVGILMVLGILVGLALVYRIFVRSIVNMPGWMGLFFQFLFYLPCLLIEVLESFFTELRQAPTMILVLFVIEICIVLIYFYGSTLASAVYSNESTALLPNAVFLKERTTIATSNTFEIPPSDPTYATDKNGNPLYRKNYSISMWVYVNPTPSQSYSKESNIFQYGSTGSLSGNPRITYSKNMYTFYLSNTSKEAKYQTQLAGQSWHNIVLNYNENLVDIFIDGNLETTVVLPSPPKYRASDAVTVGDGNGMLYGAICNVQYYPTPVTKLQVTGAYNLLMYKNPPIQ